VSFRGTLRGEESLSLDFKKTEISHFVRNDIQGGFFRSLLEERGLLRVDELRA
jgi:hypothetical protein